jgi:amidase
VTRVGPAFGPGIGDRFAAAARLDPGQIEVARRVREAVRARLADIVPPGTLLVIPTAPGIAPLLSSTEVELETFRARALALLCAAGHAGMPQISLPMATLEGCPLGLSVIAAHGQDEALLDLAVLLAAPEADNGRA